MIIEAIETATIKAGHEREKFSPLRLSNAGRCARQTAYDLHGFEGEPLDGRAILTFQHGNITESVMKEWTEKGGVTIHDQQREVTLEVEGRAIPGHIDGTFEEGGVRHVVDFKSINTLGFDRVQRDGTDRAYRAQVTAYMEAAGLQTFAVVAYLNKNTQHLHEDVIPYDSMLVAEIRDRFKRVVQSTKDVLPDREHRQIPEVIRKKATGRWVLPWECGYCGHKRTCWGVETPEFSGGGRPIWVVDAPKVGETAGVKW